MVPIILTIFGIARLNNKSARERQQGKVALYVAGAWTAVELALWYMWLRKMREMGQDFVASGETGGKPKPRLTLLPTEKLGLG